MLSTEEICHIARLARIRLTEDEEKKYQKDLSQVLDFFQELQTADTVDVGAVGMITGKENAARPDEVVGMPASERRAIVDLFPRKQGDTLEVPSVF